MVEIIGTSRDVGSCLLGDTRKTSLNLQSSQLLTYGIRAPAVRRCALWDFR